MVHREASLMSHGPTGTSRRFAGLAAYHMLDRRWLPRSSTHMMCAGPATESGLGNGHMASRENCLIL